MAQEPPRGDGFSGIRGFLWPIHRHELRKLLPMLGMFFLISLVYSLLRNTKDTLVVTTAGGGAGLIPFVKVYGTIPASMAIMAAYAALSARLGKTAVFRISVGFFMVFFLVFAAVFPYRAALSPSLGEGLGGFAGHATALLRLWMPSLFYTMSELWGSMALSLLFWGFANDITRVEESRRFYGLFGIGANLALMTVPLANRALKTLEGFLDRGGGAWEAYILALAILVAVCGTGIMALHAHLQNRVLTDPRFAASVDPALRKGAGAALSLGTGLHVLKEVRSLRYIAVLVLAYGISINLVEVTWKHQLSLLHPEPMAYQDYMARFSLATGAAAVFLMLFVSSNVIRRLGWTMAALATPVVLLATGAGFFAFILLGPILQGLLAGLGTTSNAVAVALGATQNVLSKATKYSLFDPTKEMAYIPLDQEAKVKGKAAIDVVAHRLGKAGGSLIQQVLIALLGSLGAITFPIAAILVAMIGSWIWAVRRLGWEFRRTTESS